MVYADVLVGSRLDKCVCIKVTRKSPTLSWTFAQGFFWLDKHPALVGQIPIFQSPAEILKQPEDPLAPAVSGRRVILY